MLPASFTSRPASFDDIPSITVLLNSASDTGHVTHFADDMRAEWETPYFHPESSIRLVFSSENVLVGYIEVWDVDEPPVRPTIWGRVHPDYHGLGIGRYLMQWADQRDIR